MDNTFNASATIFIGTILQAISTAPQLGAELNFTLREDREKFKKTVIWNQRNLASRMVPILQSMSDAYPNVSSSNDYTNQDVVGSYPADDPRAGWWLISSGCSYVHLVIGYPDVLVKQSVEAEGLQTEVPGEIDPNDQLICDFVPEDYDRLIDIFSIVSAAPEINEDDIEEIDSRIRKFQPYVHTTVQELLGNELMGKVAYLPHRHFLEVASYQAGIYIYSIDPEQQTLIGNTAISIRRFDDSHVIYYFKENTLHREPSFTLDTSVHDAIMNG